MKWLTTYPREGAVRLSDLPGTDYASLYTELKERLWDENCHLGAYFGWPSPEGLRLICLLLDDATGEISLASVPYEGEVLPSLSAEHPALHVFEREMAENFGVMFADSPWDKPLRYAHDRADRRTGMNDYPFYSIQGEALHEVNVGPIHAGVIEPGCFRFICNGEQIIHLEIMLGYQHRGVERLLRETDNRLRQIVLSESIAGDSTVAHGTACAMAFEKLGGLRVSESLELERAVALELERIALHIADTGALCTDIAYQLGQVACEALRTIVINTTQAWCGNRFGKGLIRPGGSYFPLTAELRAKVLENLNEVERRYAEVADNLNETTSVLSRFEDCGIVTTQQALRIGAVGLAARASGLARDLRATHPWGPYGRTITHDAFTRPEGDVAARLRVRLGEVARSVVCIRSMIGRLEEFSGVAPSLPDYGFALAPDSLAFALIEGWRGEVAHVALTDGEGRIAAYKVKDPSLHNWMALALSVRGEGISDFPICNKSFNLSYCGHDL